MAEAIDILPRLENREGVELVQLLRCIDPSDTSAATDNLLTVSEEQRVQRLKHPCNRAQLARTLSARRQYLSDYLKQRPDDVFIGYDEAGAPCLSDWPVKKVSFSRSRDWTALALSRSPDIGIDIEVKRSLNWEPMIDLICFPEEAASIRKLFRTENALRCFFRLWVAKEAVLKLTGKGFKADPRTISVPEAMLTTDQSGELVVGETLISLDVQDIDPVILAVARTIDQS